MIKVDNVHHDATPELLRSFFEFHGQILRTQYATTLVATHDPHSTSYSSTCPPHTTSCRARSIASSNPPHTRCPAGGRIKGKPDMRCGFIEFSNSSAAKSALLFDRSSFVGPQIEIEPCDEVVRTPNPPQAPNPTLTRSADQC